MVIVRAIAYSGLPDCRNLMRRVALRMPGRRVMIDSYLAGTLPTLAGSRWRNQARTLTR